MDMNIPRWTLLLMVCLLLAVSGCAPRTPSQNMGSTQTPNGLPPPALNTPTLPGPTRTPGPTGTPLPTLTVRPTAAPLPSPTATPPVPTPTPGVIHSILVFPVYESPFGYLLGASQDGNWRTVEDAAALPQPQETYALYSVLERQGSAVGGEPVEEMVCPSFWSVPVEHETGLVAAIAGEWDALPRIPQKVDVNDAQAVQQVANFLTAQGISQPQVKIQRILKADLDGDGTQEFVVAASRFVEETGHDVSPGDYSLVLLYRDGQAALPVVSDWYTKEGPMTFPDRFELSALLDLNGDGRLEILVGITGWEQTGALAYTVDGSALENVLQARCP